MRLSVDITKRHFYSILAVLVILLGGAFVIGYGTEDPVVFGHDADELELTNSITSSDIVNDAIDSGHVSDGSLTSSDISVDAGTGRLALNVLRAFDADNADKLNNKFENDLEVAKADNADAADCEFLITECDGVSLSNQCASGFSQLDGEFSFSSGATAGSQECSGSGEMTLCCKNP